METNQQIREFLNTILLMLPVNLRLIWSLYSAATPMIPIDLFAPNSKNSDILILSTAQEISLWVRS